MKIKRKTHLAMLPNLKNMVGHKIKSRTNTTTDFVITTLFYTVHKICVIYKSKKNITYSNQFHNFSMYTATPNPQTGHGYRFCKHDIILHSIQN